MRFLSFPKVTNLGTARRRECKFETVAKKATPRRRERSRAQKWPRRASESANAPRAGESEIGPILGTVRKREHIFENGHKKMAATRRRELHLEAAGPPHAGESLILEHFEEIARWQETHRAQARAHAAQFRRTSGPPPPHLRRTSAAPPPHLGPKRAQREGGRESIFIRNSDQDKTMCIEEMRTFPPSLPVHRNTVAMRFLSFSKVPNLGTARRRECKFENVAKNNNAAQARAQ